ncbi:MAG: hypothetical protein ABSE73_18680 [Planctomycetota bacterium]
MTRSLMFSLESFADFRPRCPATLLAVAGLVAALEVALRLVPEGLLIPAHSREVELLFMEREVLARVPQPQVVLLGSSRLRYAVAPGLLDERLGLPPASTLNAGLDGAHAFEALLFYERNRARLKHARLVILYTDEWYLSSGWQLGPLFEMHAPWPDRLGLPEPQRTRMLLDGIFSMRLRLRMIFETVSNRLSWRKADVLELKLDENNQVVPLRPRPIQAVAGDPARYDGTIEAFYSHFAICQVQMGHLEKLGRLVREDGGRFVIMQFPNRSAYQGEVQKLHAAEYAQHLAALGALAQRLDVPLAVFAEPSACGLSDYDYADYGHFTPAGARKFTEFLADTIKKEGWLR